DRFHKPPPNVLTEARFVASLTLADPDACTQYNTASQSEISKYLLVTAIEDVFYPDKRGHWPANSYVDARSETKYPGLLVNGTPYVEKSLSARRPTACVDQRAVHFRPIQVTVRSPECLGRRNSGSPGRNGNDN